MTHCGSVSQLSVCSKHSSRSAPLCLPLAKTQTSTEFTRKSLVSLFSCVHCAEISVPCISHPIHLYCSALHLNYNSQCPQQLLYPLPATGWLRSMAARKGGQVGNHAAALSQCCAAAAGRRGWRERQPIAISSHRCPRSIEVAVGPELSPLSDP